jgi:hypothetical protein
MPCYPATSRSEKYVQLGTQGRDMNLGIDVPFPLNPCQWVSCQHGSRRHIRKMPVVVILLFTIGIKLMKASGYLSSLLTHHFQI